MIYAYCSDHMQQIYLKFVKCRDGLIKANLGIQKVAKILSVLLPATDVAQINFENEKKRVEILNFSDLLRIFNDIIFIRRRW